MLILNLNGFLPEKLIISLYFNVSIETLSNKYKKNSFEYNQIRKAIEIEKVSRIENFKGEGLILESAFDSSKQQNKFLYYRIISIYKELLDDAKYLVEREEDYVHPISFILNEISSNLKDVKYKNMELTNFFGGLNEKSFEEYFLDLFNFIKEKIKPNNTILNNTSPLICIKPFEFRSEFLTNMDIEPYRIRHIEGYTSILEKFYDELELLKVFGSLLDNVFNTRKDADKYIFILKNIPTSGDDTYSSFLVLISILELFKKNGFSWTDIEKEEVSQYFYGSYWTAPKEEVNLIIKIRNKLVHADYTHFFNLLDEYKNEYMKDFEFDKFEATDYKTIFDSITIKVKEAVANIVWDDLNK
ncbi:hypothetical protein [Enterococcus sp. N249-2]